ncbi:hypothetical protein Slin14017_G111850 [Septoria linicola]|nr:hypothetical protein Slin14017_G111850 [Septoria linicola]
MTATYQAAKSMEPQKRTAVAMNMKTFNNRGKQLAKNSPAQDLLQQMVDMLRRRVATPLKSGYAQSKETNVFRDVGLRARRAWKTANQLKAGLLTKAMAKESEICLADLDSKVQVARLGGPKTGRI